MTSTTENTILLMAYGTPSNQNDIEAYLTDIKRGHKPTTTEIEDLKRRYLEIGGYSPLQEITAAQASRLESALNSDGIKISVHFGMKHWHPYIDETVQKLLQSGIRRLLGLVLAPYYSRMSIGGYKSILQNSLANSQIEIDFIDSWYDNPIYHHAVSEKIVEALEKFPIDEDKQVIFTAHSLPERIILDGDPYSSQLLASCKAVANLSKIEKWEFAYQSAGHTPDKWLGPDILETLTDIGNAGNVLIVPIGFVSDHLEILYDIDIEARTFAKTRGINLQRTESLNTSSTFIAALVDVVRNRLPSS